MSDLAGGTSKSGTEDTMRHERAEVESANEDEWWAVVGNLWHKATGGADVAASPGNAQSAWSTVTPAPGVTEACDWLRNSEGGVARFVMLVGGPGAGKSQALVSLVADLQEVDRSDSGLAERSYRYGMGERELVVVNDATILKRKDGKSLAADLDRAIDAGDHLFACVNRGILVEEASAIGQPASAGESLVHWLARGARVSMDGACAIQRGESTDFVTPARVLIDGLHVADVVTVFVDVCSLFERRPAATIVDEGPVFLAAGDSYEVTRLVDRGGLHERSTPAGNLLTTVLARLALPPELPPEWSPVAANVQSLSSRRVRSGLMTVLRASEIVTGSRMTFREIWGAYARCVVGGLPGEVNEDEAREFIAGLRPTTDDPLGTFTAMRTLAAYRYSEAIFGGDEASDTNPVTRTTRLVDPTLDAVPGTLTVAKANSGWSTPVLEAFSGLVTAASPLETIIEVVGEGDGFPDAVTQFDRLLDQAFVAVTGPGGLADRHREAAIAWYGAYLLRLYALANGIPAFRHEVALWTQVWSLGENIPHALEASLKTLLRPRRDPNDPDSSLLLPIFESRTTPITGAQASPKLAVRGSDVSVKASRQGDSIFLRMIENANEVGTMELDFPVIRAAQSCAHGHVGITEVSNDADPRLERFRAQRLVPDRLSSGFCLLNEGKELVVSVEVPD